MTTVMLYRATLFETKTPAHKALSINYNMSAYRAQTLGVFHKITQVVEDLWAGVVKPYMRVSADKSSVISLNVAQYLIVRVRSSIIQPVFR